MLIQLNNPIKLLLRQNPLKSFYIRYYNARHYSQNEPNEQVRVRFAPSPTGKKYL